MFAGHETTTNLITNGLMELLNSPDREARINFIKNNPDLMEQWIDEMVRLHSPVQAIGGETIQGTEIISKNGTSTVIPAGDAFICLLGRANRDAAKFKCPAMFDITDKKDPNLAFSRGRHVCLGRHLARLETGIAIGTLLRRLNGMRLADEDQLAWKPNVALKGLFSLTITWDSVNE